MSDTMTIGRKFTINISNSISKYEEMSEEKITVTDTVIVNGRYWAWIKNRAIGEKEGEDK